MSHVYTGDLALETTTTTGTGALTLAGTIAGHQTLAQSGVSNGDTVELVIRAVNSNGIPTGDWERSICTYSTTGPTITRTTVLQSSNSDSAVNFGAGTKRVYRVATQEHEFLIQNAIDIQSSGLISGTNVISINADPTKLDVAACPVQVNAGTGVNGTMKRIQYAGSTGNSNIGAGYNHVAITAAGALSISATEQDRTTHAYLGKLFYNSAAGAFTTNWNIPEVVGNYAAVNNKFLREGIGSIISDGMVISPGSTALTLNMTSGTCFFANIKKTVTGGTPITFLRLYLNTDQIVSIDGSTSGETTLNTTQWNDSTQVAASARVTMTNGYYKKDVVIINPDGNKYYVLGGAEYATEAEARAAPINGFNVFYPDLNMFTAEIIIQKGISSITSDKIVDIRPYLPRVYYNRPSIYYDQLLNTPDHNDLPVLQGGTTGEYYHSTSAQNTYLGTIAAAGNAAVIAATTASFLTADETKLDGIAAGATVGATWGSNITSQPSVVSQAEAEAGTATTERIWTAERVNQAIQALAPGGGGGGISLGKALAVSKGMPLP